MVEELPARGIPDLRHIYDTAFWLLIVGLQSSGLTIDNDGKLRFLRRMNQSNQIQTSHFKKFVFYFHRTQKKAEHFLRSLQRNFWIFPFTFVEKGTDLSGWEYTKISHTTYSR